MLLNANVNLTLSSANSTPFWTLQTNLLSCHILDSGSFSLNQQKNQSVNYSKCRLRIYLLCLQIMVYYYNRQKKYSNLNGLSFITHV